MIELKILFKSILRTTENLPTHLYMSFMMDVMSRRRKYTGCPAQMNSFALIDIRTCFVADISHRASDGAQCVRDHIHTYTIG